MCVCPKVVVKGESCSSYPGSGTYDGKPKAANSSSCVFAEGGGDRGKPCEGVLSSYFFALRSVRSVQTSLKPDRKREGVIILAGLALAFRAVDDGPVATVAFVTPVGRPRDSERAWDVFRPFAAGLRDL